MILKDKDNPTDHFDFDYQLWIIKEESKKKCKDIKDYFIKLFQEHFKEKELKVQKSTFEIIIKEIENYFINLFKKYFQEIKQKNEESTFEIISEEIEDYFIKLFQKYFPEKEWKVEDSTSVITIKNKKENYSYDVAIIKTIFKPLKANILKHYKKTNESKWEEIREYKDHQENLKIIIGPELWNELRNKYKDKKENNTNKTESYLLFIEAVHDVAQKQ